MSHQACLNCCIDNTDVPNIPIDIDLECCAKVTMGDDRRRVVALFFRFIGLSSVSAGSWAARVLRREQYSHHPPDVHERRRFH